MFSFETLKQEIMSTVWQTYDLGNPKIVKINSNPLEFRTKHSGARKKISNFLDPMFLYDYNVVD